MALDRTWYNSLIDDDGSGLTGSVWDKADVDALMDAVDAELVRVEPRGWIDYSPSLLPQAGTWTPAQSFGRHHADGTLGKTVFIQLSIEAITASVATQVCKVSLPYPAAAWAGTQMVAIPIFHSGSYEIGHGSIIQSDPWYISIGRPTNQNFPAAGGIYIRGQFWYLAA